MIKTTAAISAATLALTLSFSSAYAYVDSKPAVSVKLDLAKSKGIKNLEIIPVFNGTTLTANASTANNSPAALTEFTYTAVDPNSLLSVDIEGENVGIALGSGTYSLKIFETDKVDSCLNWSTLSSNQIKSGSLSDIYFVCYMKQ